MQTPHRNLLNGLRTPVLVFIACVSPASAQAPPDNPALEQILNRLDRLEQQNRELVQEVRALRNELARARTDQVQPQPETSPTESTPAGDLAERVAVQGQRIEDQAQTKVEASQRFPIRITGMALFNASLSSKPSFGWAVPIVAPLSGTALTGTATLRQSIIGLDFNGPDTFGGGKVRGFLNLDFFGGSGESYDSLIRLRTAGVQVDWAATSIMFGQDKPLIAPREPNSLAQVGFSPLTGAGNLWAWQPQARVEQRFSIDERTTIRAQAGVFATREDNAYVPPAYASAEFQNVRPALQTRLSFTHALDDNRRLEIGSGFGASTTHFAGASVPSRVFTLDWFANPWRKLEFSGAFFHGQNLANLGGLGQGFIVREYAVIPVHANGGWAQASFIATRRLTFNLFGGEQANRNQDIQYHSLAANQAYAANLMYRLAPNVILSFEAGQVRTNYFGVGNRLNNYHDLGFAYLF